MVDLQFTDMRMTSGTSRHWSVLAIALLCGYFVAGIFGRFPWKADEPYSFGIIWEMLEDHSWLIPSVADQPFVEKPPLVYWLGAAFAKMLPFVPPYESSRLAILLLLATSVVALYRSARWLHPEVTGWLRAFTPCNRCAERAYFPGSINAPMHGLLAIVLMAGTLGFAEHIHKLTADLGQLAGATIGLCGLVAIGIGSAARRADGRNLRAPLIGALMLGTGIGVAFMSKGLLVPGVLTATWLCCLFIPVYRSRTGTAALAAALAAASPWLVIWPIWLHHASPALLDEWLWDNNFGRFFGYVALGGNNVSIGSKTLSTVAMGFPPLLLFAWVAARTLSRARSVDPARRWSLLHDAPGHVCVAIYLAISLIALGVSASMRDIYLLPVLPAMVLLGLPALSLEMRASPPHVKWVVNAGFGAAAALVGLVWFSLVVTGDLSLFSGVQALVSRYLPLPFDLPFNWAAVIATVATLLVWSYASRRDPMHSATIAWCSGIAMLWVVTSSLLLPWIDAARSYKTIFAEVTTYVAMSDGCVATLNLGESELALLEYVTSAEITRSYLGHSGTGARSRPNPAAVECPWLLVRSNRSSGRLRPDSERWTSVWTGARPADRNEAFALYRAQAERPWRKVGNAGDGPSADAVPLRHRVARPRSQR